ncbi:MAG: DNA starvation/stationary phase protection protein, partial [Prevotella shahii]|nr:DNA starvation/stationary phase protection protein [Hoylesella shahii]
MNTLNYLGLDEKKVQPVVNGLSQLLADFQVVYTNLRGL